MIVTAKNCWSRAHKKHKEYFDKAVEAAREKNKVTLTAPIYDFLVKNHDLIRDGNETDFRNLQLEFNAICLPIPAISKKAIDTALCQIFDYSAFSRKCRVRWCAYKLCATLDIETCPYCNLSAEITIIKDSDGKIRPAIDHFFDKARYPLFAISLGNFIPSCHHCNSTFKGTKDFYAEPHLNPQYDIESIKFSLDIDPIDARIDISKLDNANIRVIYDKMAQKELNTVSTFEISDQYQARIIEIREIVKNMVNYSTSGIKNPINRDWVMRNITKTNYRNRILGKMFLDFESEYI
jgi:hypothetical protein